MNLILLRFLSIAGIAVTLMVGGYLYGKKVEHNAMQVKLDKMQLDHNTDLAAAQNIAIRNSIKNDQLKAQLETQHAQANKAINVLMDTPVNSVQLPTTECSYSNSNSSDASSGSQSTIESNGVLLKEAERILDEDRQRTKEIIGEAEKELAECRVSKEWAANQK